MEKEKSRAKPPSKKERAEKLMQALAKWQEKDGLTIEQAIEKLTPHQYDFLIDYGINFDDALLTQEQQKAIQEVKKAKRPVGLTYNKKYPQEKQDLYNSIVAFLQKQKFKVTPQPKDNFRIINFSVGGTPYKIVLSNPRTNNENEND